MLFRTVSNYIFTDYKLNINGSIVSSVSSPSLYSKHVIT